MHAFEAVCADKAPSLLDAVIIGAGFGGIGMAIALKKAGAGNFLILEKAPDVGGVWRDNSYPGAACDVPSHLYSFSFAPNSDWTRVFATQPEIHAYLRRCANQYNVRPRIRFDAKVEQAVFDEQRSVWQVTLASGETLHARLLISATGQLSRPSLPKIEGIETFKGHAFHSASWDHAYSLAGKRVAVIGTGASAIQFVPAIADAVGKLMVFQRSPAYILPRPDRGYTQLEKAMFRRLPWTMKLYRAGIYLQYESRAIAFTRFKGLMKLAAGIPFRRLLTRQVADPTLRAKLIPDYPIGCKRILLSSEYLATMNKPNVSLVTDRIRRITEDGIETSDGKHHRADAIVYGTGFAATEFLSPMRIIGRSGIDLNEAWRLGAQAYLGITVPGFPNFFMLYGPNTNLGHNSIVYMLESQIAHVMRCYKAMRASDASAIEVDRERYRRFNVHIQNRLANTVWNGCKSWYVDESGHNSTNWPGFTLSYRWITRFSGLHAYRFTRELAGVTNGIAVATPACALEALTAVILRGILRTGFRPFVGPPWGPGVQRSVVAMLSPLMPGVRGARRHVRDANGVPTEVVTAKAGEARGALLYLHGGAFCLGSAWTHRSITTRLAAESGMPVWVPEYRLAPEHPYPAALDDAIAAYEAMLADGYRADDIVIAGDSAGGALALALALRLRENGAPMPAGLLLISPVTDGTLSGSTMNMLRRKDPMIRRGWLEQGLDWYHCPDSVAAHRPLEVDLRGLPPILIQVGDEEVLLADSTRLAEHAARCGVDCRIEVHAARWHVFHLSSFYLQSAKDALRRLAEFARARVVSAPAPSGMHAFIEGKKS